MQIRGKSFGFPGKVVRDYKILRGLAFIPNIYVNVYVRKKDDGKKTLKCGHWDVKQQMGYKE